jgi:uncharacterized membrane protein YwaF
LGWGSLWQIWALRLEIFWGVWAVVDLGITWVLIIHLSAQQTRRWALEERVPPRSHLSKLRSVIVRVLWALFLVSRTSSLLFIVFVSLVGMSLAIILTPDVRDLETTGGISVAFTAALGVISAWGVLHTAMHCTTLIRTIDLKNRPEGLPLPPSRVQINWTSSTSPSR